MSVSLASTGISETEERLETIEPKSEETGERMDNSRLYNSLGLS